MPTRILSLLLLFVPMFSHSSVLEKIRISADLIGLTAHKGSAAILSDVYLYEDTTGTWEIEDAQLNKRVFQPVNSDIIDRISLGLSGSTWWLRLHLDSELLASNSYLMLDFSLLEEVVLYVPDEKTGYKVQRSGIAAADQGISLSNRFPVFSLGDLNSNEEIYLSVRSKSPILLPIFIKTEKRFYHDELNNNLLFGMFFGIVFLVLCYNMILFLITHDTLYFNYFVYVFFLSIVLSNYFGFSYGYLWPKNLSWIDKVMPACIMITMLSILNFMRHFLNTKVNFVFIDKVFLVMIGMYSLMLLTLPFFSSSIYYRLIAPGSSVTIVLFIIILIKSYKKNFTPATYMLFGWIFVLAGITLMVGKTFGLLPYNFFTSFSIAAGLVVEVIMFTIGIGYRFRWLKKETQQVKDQLAAKHLEIEQLQSKVANYIMDNAPKTTALPMTISKDEINGYLLNQLSERELDVIFHVAEGLANKDIGERLFISTNTVRAHMRSIYDKLHVKNRTQAVFKANQLQLILSKPSFPNSQIK